MPLSSRPSRRDGRHPNFCLFPVYSSFGPRRTENSGAPDCLRRELSFCEKKIFPPFRPNRKFSGGKEISRVQSAFEGKRGKNRAKPASLVDVSRPRANDRNPNALRPALPAPRSTQRARNQNDPFVWLSEWIEPSASARCVRNLSGLPKEKRKKEKRKFSFFAISKALFNFCTFQSALYWAQQTGSKHFQLTANGSLSQVMQRTFLKWKIFKNLDSKNLFTYWNRITVDWLNANRKIKATPPPLSFRRNSDDLL